MTFFEALQPFMAVLSPALILATKHICLFAEVTMLIKRLCYLETFGHSTTISFVL